MRTCPKFRGTMVTGVKCQCFVDWLKEPGRVPGALRRRSSGQSLTPTGVVVEIFKNMVVQDQKNGH